MGGSTFVTIIVVPFEQTGIWRNSTIFARYKDVLAMQGIIIPAIFKFLSNAAADFKFVVRIYGHIPTIEQFVYITSEQYSIGRLMFPHPGYTV